MEDSIEDYVRISKNVEDKKEQSVKISQQLAVTAQRKKECEAYALKVVEFLIEGKLKPELFLRCLKYINPEYYQDVVEERSLGRLCGYSLCRKKIPDMPKQKYIILSKANKVYEITDRKNYCSNFCYKASLHIKKQLDSSPLWLRNHNEEPELNLLPASEMGTPGEYIDQGVAKPAATEKEFTSITHFAQYSLEEVDEKEKRRRVKTKLKIHRCSLNVINENEENEVDCDNISVQNESDEDCSSVKSLDLVEEIETKIQQMSISTEKKVIKKVKAESPGRINTEDKQKLKSMNQKEKLEYLKKKLKISKEPKTKLVEAQPLQLTKTKLEAITEVTESNIQENKNSAMIIDESLLKIKNCVFEWVTIDTYIFIYGEKKVKEILNEKKLLECFDRLKIAELGTQQRLKYLDICRKLQLQELAEERFDNELTADDRELKPLPDYKKLKEESKELDLKVKAFYSGTLYEQEDRNFPQNNKENEDEPIAVLPLVEVYSQNALRQRVFFNSINKILKKHIQDFKLGGNGVLSDIHDLVRTFKLQAHNIIFKPVQWNVVCIVLLDMLSVKDSNLKNKLQDARRKAYVHLVTSRISGAEIFFKEVLKTIADIDNYIEKYITNDQ